MFLEAGIFLKFERIDKKNFFEIKEAVEKNAYKREVYEYKDN